jgi:phage shock protein E
MKNINQREKLLALFQQTQHVLQDFIEGCSEDERTELEMADQWTAKETLAAIGAWMNYTVERLGYFTRGTAPPREVDFDAVNQQALAICHTQTWDEVVVSLNQSQARLIEAVAVSSENIFHRLNAYGDGTGDEFWGEVQANGFIWPLQEIEKQELRFGRKNQASTIRTLLETVIGLPVICTVISREQFREQQQGSIPPLVIDVRDVEDYQNGHLDGAINIPFDELSDAELPSNRTLLTYCNMHQPGYSRSERAASLLESRGYQVAALAEGYPGWADAGLSTQAGS